LLSNGSFVAYSFDEAAHDASMARKLSAREQQALFDVRHYLKDDLLCKVDRATMQFSLETRVPLLDYRIVEFALNLDESLKVRNGTSKYLLKKVLYQYVPEEMFARPKWGFSIPLDRWMRNDLSFLIDRYASQKACEAFGLIKYTSLKKYIDEYRSGTTYYYNRIWQVIVLHRLLDRIELNS
jgi:asparagine synthase (glutamine-hydrolysing)